MCSPSAQYGAGLYINNDGTATLTDTNVYSNVAEVSEPAYLSSSAPLERYVVLAFCMQSGGGIGVSSGGTANLNGCQVYENQAGVRAAVPGPLLHRPAELTHLAVLATRAHRPRNTGWVLRLEPTRADPPAPHWNVT